MRGIDLNLLVILDALLDEGHVTRAAQRLGLSQSAASNALERCRHLFGDPLLERAAGGMRLSPRAETLRPQLRAVLLELQAVIQSSEVDLSAVRRTVRVVMADLPAMMIATGLHRCLADSAPGVDLVIQPWHGAHAAQEALGRGDSDLAVSVFPSMGTDFRRSELFHEHYVVIMRKGHPAASLFNLDAWLAWPHLLISGRGETRGALDDVLAPAGLHRRVALVVPNFSMAPGIVAQSDLVAMVPSRSLTPENRPGLDVFDPPVPVPGFPLHLAWHRRRDDDPVVQHVAKLIGAILKT